MAETGTPVLAYATIGLGVIGLIMTITLGGILSLVGGLLTGASALFGILIIRYDYIFLPMITQKTRTIVMPDLGVYEIPPSQDVIVKTIGNNYYASAFLGIEIFKSPTEETREENLKYNEFFERAISNLRYVTKIAYLIQVEDISGKKREIEARRNEVQAKLAKERQKPLDKEGRQRLAIDVYEKEFEIWNGQLTTISKGKKPMGVVAYAMTTAAGISKDAAVSNAKAHAEEIKIAIANSLNAEVRMLSGNEMLRCFEWERFFPTSVQELEAEAMTDIS